jgi:hypothetical protein
MLALVLAASAMVPASPAQTNTAATDQPPLDENRFVRLFLYRLHYFHRTAAQQDCLRAHPERTRALDARYDALERRAVALLGPVPRHSDTDRRRDGYDDDCGRGIILNGYELALHDLELRLAEVER